MKEQKKTYLSQDGTAITDEMVDRWADEAENGYPDSADIRPAEGRPWES
ncbi:hypothetical protein KIM372_01810 [Bombiscardovia nodaiensis]|uniref:CopG family transcriptional regulator n=1 Tax=Bombiscardovia nodaiensis TaxID=2932181 RepID=A0ABM8B5Y4_9BIFI|nr:hypothetical protein KIM372_01810 [Bombiscardovia nodaiensis]